jgi:hypothetical protein
MGQARFKIGRYGSGTLSCVRNDHAQFIVFKSLPIAKRDGDTWTALADHELTGQHLRRP